MAQAAQENPNAAPLRALVFEDDALVRTWIVRVLEQRGYQVCAYPEATICQSCLSPLGHRCADLVISDVSMPGWSGLDFLIQHHKIKCRIQSIALMSGSWSDEDLECAHAEDCQVFYKPLQIPALMDWLEQCERAVDPHRVLTDHLQKLAAKTPDEDKGAENVRPLPDV